MSKVLKIALTPFMAILALGIVTTGAFYYLVLVKIYEFAWQGWDN